jgi:hypothetical protein
MVRTISGKPSAGPNACANRVENQPGAAGVAASICLPKFRAQV